MTGTDAVTVKLPNVPVKAAYVSKVPVNTLGLEYIGISPLISPLPLQENL